MLLNLEPCHNSNKTATHRYVSNLNYEIIMDKLRRNPKKMDVIYENMEDLLVMIPQENSTRHPT